MMYKHLHRIARIPEKYEEIRNINLKNLDIINVLMKNDRVREFVWLDTRSPEEEMVLTHTNERLKLPEGFEFLPVERSIVIKKERENKEQYMNLLLEADSSEKLIRQYLVDGDLFTLTYKNEVACVAVVTKVDNDTCELKDIATEEKYRGKGYAKKMIKYLCDNYKQKYNKMLIGTTENNIPFYVKQGFDKYEKTIKNFFVDNYDEKILDGDLYCTDMYYYSKNLKMNNSKE